MFTQHKNPGFTNRFKIISSEGGLLHLPQAGGGLGDIFKTFLRWIIPAGKTVLKEGVSLVETAAKSNLAKNAAKTLKREAVNAGIDLAQAVLKGEKELKKNVKKKAKGIKENVTETISVSLDDYKVPRKKKEKR